MFVSGEKCPYVWHHLTSQRLVHMLAHLGYSEYTWVLKYIKGICFRYFGGCVISYGWYLAIYCFWSQFMSVTDFQTHCCHVPSTFVLHFCLCLRLMVVLHSHPHILLWEIREKLYLALVISEFSQNIMLLVGSGLSCKERTGQKWVDFFF